MFPSSFSMDIDNVSGGENDVMKEGSEKMK
jgi:hypothetical protein